jgi:acyl dehydratase
MSVLTSTDPIVKDVTGEELAAYRAVTRATRDPGPASSGASAPSPIHPFIVAWSTFDRAVEEVSRGTTQAVVHLAQEIRQRRPVGAGERVALDLDVRGARRDPRGVRLAMGVTLVGAGGAPFADITTSLLLVGARAPDPFGSLPSLAGGASGSGPTDVVTLDVPTDLPARYADVSGDRNPIHLDADAAQAAGFPGVIAHGMSVLALVCEEVVDRYVDGDASRVRGIGCRFSSPVAPGAPLDVSLSPEGDGGDTGRVRFACKTPGGTALKNGWVEWVTS